MTQKNQSHGQGEGGVTANIVQHHPNEELQTDHDHIKKVHAVYTYINETGMQERHQVQ